MKATDNKLPTATGRMPDNGASECWKNPIHSINLVPTIVKAKCRNDKKTMKLYPSTSVMYLLQITIPTTDKMLDTTPTMITRFDMLKSDS